MEIKETQTQLKEIVKNSPLKWADVTLDPSGYPRSVGELIALIGFKDQRDAEYFAELTEGEFCQFFKKDGWQLLYPSVRHAQKKSVSELAHPYPTIFLNGNENYHEICENVYGIPLIEYARNTIDLDIIDDDWVEMLIAHFDSDDYHTFYPDYITGNLELEDDFDITRSALNNIRRNLDKYKGYKGYVVIDDINDHIENTYDTEYPAHYTEDNRNYFYGVLYSSEKESEIVELLEEL